MATLGPGIALPLSWWQDLGFKTNHQCLQTAKSTSVGWQNIRIYNKWLTISKGVSSKGTVNLSLCNIHCHGFYNSQDQLCSKNSWASKQLNCMVHTIIEGKTIPTYPPRQHPFTQHNLAHYQYESQHLSSYFHFANDSIYLVTNHAASIIVCPICCCYKSHASHFHYYWQNSMRCWDNAKQFVCCQPRYHACW